MLLCSKSQVDQKKKKKVLVAALETIEEDQKVLLGQGG